MHVEGQLISPPLTAPPPEIEIVSRRVSTDFDHDALTERSPSTATVQATLLPLQAPPQPLKTLPAAGTSSTVNVEPVRTVHVQSVPAGAEPQSMLPPLTLPSPA